MTLFTRADAGIPGEAGKALYYPSRSMKDGPNRRREHT
jgi:hypothetical protein